MSRRVVITGIGMVSPVAADFKQSWNRLCSGEVGATAIPKDWKACPVANVGFVSADFDARKWKLFLGLAPTDLNAYMYSASFEALQDARYADDYDAERVGFTVSSVAQEQRAMSIDKLKEPSKTALFKGWTSISGSIISDRFDLRGPGFCYSTACSGGLTGIGESMWRIKTGEADAMLIITGDAIDELSVCTLAKVISSEAKPFDVNRNGFVFAEGACAIFVEAAELAEARGVKPYAEVVGYACNTEARETSPRDYGAQIEEAVKRATKGQQVDLVYAHANGTKNDIVEARTLERMFSSVAVTSIKGSVGHAQGAIGTMNLAFAAASLRHNMIPGIVGLEKPIDAKVNFVRKLRRQEVERVLCNSSGLGGVNASVMLKKP